MRRLIAGDADLVAHLEALARAAAADQRGGRAWLDETAAVTNWQPLVDDGEHPVWVATVDDVAVGYLASEVNAAVCRVRQVFVHPDARSVGLGDALLAAAVDHARHVGCRSVEGTALPGDRSTKNLYERAGITARKIVVSLDL